MTIPSASIPSGRRSLIRQVATAAAVLAAVLAATTIPAAADPSSIAPPPNSSATSVPPPPTGTTVRKASPTTTTTGAGDGSGTSDGYILILEVPSTAVQGTTITVHGGNWLCSKVTVTPGWTTSATTVTVTSYKFDTTVTVPTGATPGKSTLTATCTADSSITSTKPITVLAARKVTTDPIVTSDPDETNPTPPTADAQGPENKSGTSSVGPLAVSAALILAAIVGAVTLLGRRTPAPESPATGNSRAPGPAPLRSREPDTAQPGGRAPGAAPFGRRTAESPRFGSPAPSPQHTGRVPDVQVRVHQDPSPRLDIRTFPSRPPSVQIRVHRAEPITTVREVRR
ncbi:hypothetical protein ACQP1G_37175 [Nocardia sp. CA-107356]|uniref:hypothetical protein n=1 Tax=Nocardia sp. CA-107356 TaxID=3239972 RepID=UPI003D947A0A